MKTNRMKHLMGAAIMACILGQANAAQGYNVYFSDSESGCVFGKTANSEDQEAYLVSGQTTLSANCIFFLDQYKALFNPTGYPNTIILTDTETHQTEQIDLVPQDHEVHQIAGALSNDSFLFITEKEADSFLYKATFNSTSQSWSATEEFTWSTPDYRDSIQVIQITEDKYILLEYVDWKDNLYLLDTSQPSATLVQILENDSSSQHLSKGPGSNWTYCRKESNKAYTQLFFDADGNEISPEEAQATLLDEDISRLFWSDQHPELLGATWNKLFSQNSGEYTNPPVELYASTDTNGNLILEKEIHGIEYLAPFVQGNIWVGYDSVNELPFEIDTITDTKTIKFSIEKGSGPYMGEILAIDSGEDDNLYALSSLYNKQSIFQINPSTGNRKLVIENLPKNASPYILVDHEGHFFVSKKECFTQMDESTICGTTVYEIIPTQDPTNYQFNQVGFEVSDTIIQDMTLDSSENVNILYNQRLSQFVSKLEGTSLTPSLSPISFSDYTLEQDTTYPSVDKPALIAVDSGVENSRFVAVDINFQFIEEAAVTTLKYTLTDPLNNVYSGKSNSDQSDPPNTTKCTAHILVKTTAASSAGAWKLSLTGPYDQELEITETTSLSLTFHQAPYAHQLAFTSPTSMTTYNAYTPSLTNIDLETGAFETIAITTTEQDLAYPSDFKVAPDGGFYLSTQSDCMIYQITSEGEASLFATRPNSYPTSVLGNHDTTNSSTIAFGSDIQLPPISTTGRVWWLLK